MKVEFLIEKLMRYVVDKRISADAEVVVDGIPIQSVECFERGQVEIHCVTVKYDDKVGKDKVSNSLMQRYFDVVGS